MKITMFSNFLNHHQLPFCFEMYKKLGDDFKFVATEMIPQERLLLGYEDMSMKYPFSLNTYSSDESYRKAIELGNISDVVILGSAPFEFIESRLDQNKITFYYSERIFKKGKFSILNPRLVYYLYLRHIKFRKKNAFMLCASAYTAADFNMFGAYRDKTFKWGYFPKYIDYDIEQLLTIKRQNTVPKILWVGRFLDWKHPDDAIYVANKLKKANYDFNLEIIGTGELKDKLNSLINKYKLNNNVKLLGSMSPAEVRKHMESANIFLFTSDFNEGWGAVLNEAMNSGCATIASHAIGAVPFLIENNQNGIIYKSGILSQLFDRIVYLLNNKQVCEKIGIEAYNTIKTTWNASVAAKRLINLFEEMLNGNQLFYESGPCSKAEIISNKYKS